MPWTTWVRRAAARPAQDGPAAAWAAPTYPLLPHAGKSALHWAAAVNNVEAAVVLLKNGANKDMQNNKVGSGAGVRLVGPSTSTTPF